MIENHVSHGVTIATQVTFLSRTTKEIGSEDMAKICSDLNNFLFYFAILLEIHVNIVLRKRFSSAHYKSI